ncbi:tyrosine-type recombinase/integrase [Neobacillus niacini]|uniref:tyrosine-type recombinase/integrase n=1 Tax=Neobacillus niacini TaxID=86668 RepID=UPI0020423241|nr:tyrosine-type recombinase/integrase [Neobacillus niacini]MCM3692199.1 tyrosine-type recombinase/integrase [Neobacillus niacini]
MAGRNKGKMQPIRNKDTMAKMKDWLLRNKGYKYYFLWLLGCNTGLRISDLIRLRVWDVRDTDRFTIIMEKTEREVEVHLNPYIREVIKKYIEGKEEKERLFPSREGVNRPITRQMASTVIKEAANALELKNVNSHSMRKSFGYFYYKQNRNIAYLMDLFGHNTQKQTLDYIGLTSDDIQESMKDFHV